MSLTRCSLLRPVPQWRACKTLNAGKAAQACGYFLPSAQAQCSQALSAAPTGSTLTVKGMALGYGAIDGTRALVGTAGTYCTPDGARPACFANRDPAAIFSSGRPFSTPWADTIACRELQARVLADALCRIRRQWHADALPGNGGI